MQRPLWASTSTKNPAYPDTMYVDSLIGPDTVNTIPDATLDDFEDHGTIARTVDVDVDGALAVIAAVTEAGVDLADVSRILEDQGVDAFAKSFDDLLASLTAKAESLDAARLMSVPGELRVVDDVPTAFAALVVEAFQERPLETFSFALSGGDTARGCYQALAATAGGIDWWKVDFYWGDERCVPHDDPDSNYYLAREALLDRVGAANATHLMRCAEGPDPYQLRLGELGHLDLVHLGLGPDGHTASLFPESEALRSDPGRLVTLNDDPLGNNPHRRMTLTYAGIARARQVVVTVVGADKAGALARVARGEDVPAAHIGAEQVLWLVDPAAASELDG